LMLFFNALLLAIAYILMVNALKLL
jgi:hypothetical protein